MALPLVSIVTITYNRADLIHRCIESIQKQTYRNYEHIIVDGNSSDNTEEVVNSYNDPHIKYIKLDKNGCALQLRAGADEASGKYITFLDDDDEYLPEKLEKQVELFETLPQEYGIVYCWMSYFNIENPDKMIDIHRTELRGDVRDLAPTRPLVCGTPTMMVRRDVFNMYGVTYDDNIGFVGSDWELMARICQHCLVDFVPESLVKVYVNHGHARLTTNFYGEKARRAVLFHNHFLTYFSDTFKRHPKSADYHYRSLVDAYLTLGNYHDAWHYYVRLLKIRPSVANALLPIKPIIKKILRWN